MTISLTSQDVLAWVEPDRDGDQFALKPVAQLAATGTPSHASGILTMTTAEFLRASGLSINVGALTNLSVLYIARFDADTVSNDYLVTLTAGGTNMAALKTQTNYRVLVWGRDLADGIDSLAAGEGAAVNLPSGAGDTKLYGVLARWTDTTVDVTIFDENSVAGGLATSRDSNTATNALDGTATHLNINTRHSTSSGDGSAVGFVRAIATSTIMSDADAVAIMNGGDPIGIDDLPATARDSAVPTADTRRAHRVTGLLDVVSDSAFSNQQVFMSLADSYGGVGTIDSDSDSGHPQLLTALQLVFAHAPGGLQGMGVTDFRSMPSGVDATQTHSAALPMTTRIRSGWSAKNNTDVPQVSALDATGYGSVGAKATQDEAVGGGRVGFKQVLADREAAAWMAMGLPNMYELFATRELSRAYVHYVQMGSGSGTVSLDSSPDGSSWTATGTTVASGAQDLTPAVATAALPRGTTAFSLSSSAASELLVGAMSAEGLAGIRVGGFAYGGASGMAIRDTSDGTTHIDWVAGVAGNDSVQAVIFPLMWRNSITDDEPVSEIFAYERQLHEAVMASVGSVPEVMVIPWYADYTTGSDRTAVYERYRSLRLMYAMDRGMDILRLDVVCDYTRSPGYMADGVHLYATGVRAIVDVLRRELGLGGRGRRRR
jgi:hypothetical protein